MTSPIQLWAFDPTGTTLLGELGHRWGVTWQDDFNGVGMGDVSFRPDDFDDMLAAGLVDMRNIVKLRRDGAFLPHGWRITRRERTVAGAESATPNQPLVKVSGLGCLSLLGDAVVFPPYGLRQKTGQDRWFNFASPQGVWYDVSEWDIPGATTWASMTRKTPLTAWPDPQAAWMRPSSPSSAGGSTWFRGEFSTVTDQQLSFFFAVDDDAKIYLDGDLILDIAADARLYEAVHRYDVLPLAAGDHVIAIEVIDALQIAGEVETGEAMFTVTSLAPEGGDEDAAILEPLQVIFRSGTVGCVARNDDNGRPGWTGDQVLRQLVLEGQDRDVLGCDALTLGFDNDDDSNGDPWALSVLDIKLPIKSSVLEAIPVLVDTWNIDIWVDAATMTLHAAQGRGEDRSVAVVLEPGGSLLDLGVTENAARASSLLVESDAGWEQVTDAAAEMALGGRIEDAIEVGYAASGTTAVVQAQRLLNIYANDSRDVALSHTSAVGPQPYAADGYSPGDIVGVRLDPGVLPEPQRVMAVSAQEDDAGNVTYRPELDGAEGSGEGGS